MAKSIKRRGALTIEIFTQILMSDFIASKLVDSKIQFLKQFKAASNLVKQCIVAGDLTKTQTIGTL